MLWVPVGSSVRGAVVVGSPSRGRLAVGTSHSCAIATDDVVWCWGDNTYGQLGSSAHSTLANSRTSTPVQAATLPGGRVARQITSGNFHVCVLAHDGTVWCWGDNGYGESGVAGGNQFDPVQVTLPSFASMVVAGGNSTCAVLTNSTVMCWGRNNRGQLGHGTQDITAHATPAAVTSIPSSFVVESLDVGSSHACATSTTGETWCWGAYDNGRLGTSSVSDSLTPTRLSAYGGGSASSAAAGFAHSCTVVGASAWCFGSNSSGQLGSDAASLAESSTPVAVSFTSAPDIVAAGADFTCAVLVTQTVECFGLNDEGQLGEALSTAARHTPQAVAGLSSTIADISLGTTHACAALTTGAVKCWGAGSKGQLGNGSTSRQTTAVSVGTLNIAPTTTTTTTTSTSSTTSSSSSTTSTSTSTVPATTTPSNAAVNDVPKTSQTTATLTIRRGKFITARALAKHVSMTIPKTSQGKMRFTIVTGVRHCAFVGTRVQGVRKGRCSVLITLIPKRGARVLRTAKVVVL